MCICMKIATYSVPFVLLCIGIIIIKDTKQGKKF